MAAGREENAKTDAVTSSHALNAPAPQAHRGRHLPRRSPPSPRLRDNLHTEAQDEGRTARSQAACCPLSGSVVHTPWIVCRLQTAPDPSVSRSDLDPEGSKPRQGAAGLLPTGPSMKPFSSCSPERNRAASHPGHHEWALIYFFIRLECFSTERYRDDTRLCFNTFKH